MKHYSLKTGDARIPKSHAFPEPATMNDHDIIPFGKYKGQDIVDVPSSYLEWLCLQDWFEKYPRLLKAIDGELKFRTQRGCHFEEDGGRRG